jgi:AcrR family transcriptional regulator
VKRPRLPGGRRERNKQQKLARIVSAARSLFASKGFDTTTTQEIAASVDIGTGTLFLYAKTKEDLLILIFRDEMDRVVERAFATVPARAPIVAQLVYVFDCMVAHHRRDLDLARALIRQASFVDGAQRRDDIRGFMRGLLKRIRDLIRDAQARGELRADLPATMLTRNVFAIYYSMLLEWLGGYATYDRYTRNITAALELQLSGLKSDAAISARTPPKGC